MPLLGKLSLELDLMRGLLEDAIVGPSPVHPLKLAMLKRFPQTNAVLALLTVAAKPPL